MSHAGGSSASAASSTSQALQAKRWYFTMEDLSDTPSVRAGLAIERERSYRQQAANFIQDMGQKLQVTQLCINTGIVYVQRFYMFHSFTRFHRNTMAAAALFLAAKIEEQPRKLEHVIKIAHNCLHRKQPPLDSRSEAYQEQAQELVANENILLQTLGFDVAIDHPHTHVVKCCQLVKASKELAQTSYFMATNSLHLTTMCLRYTPQVVACVCIHLACKWSNYQIPLSLQGKEWFYYIDQSATADLIEELTKEFLDIFEKSPSRLRNKIMDWAQATKEEEERRARADVAGSQYQLDLGNHHESAPSSTISSASISTASTSHTSRSESATLAGRHSSASQGQKPPQTSTSKPGPGHGAAHPRSSESLKRPSEPLPQDPHKRMRMEAGEPRRHPSEAPSQPQHAQRPSSHSAAASSRDHRPPGAHDSSQSSRAATQAHAHHGAPHHAAHHHKRESGGAGAHQAMAAQAGNKPQPQPQLDGLPGVHRHSQQQQPQPQLHHSQLLQHAQPPIPHQSQQHQNAMLSHQSLLMSQQQQQHKPQQQPPPHHQQRHQQKPHPPQAHPPSSSLLHGQIPLSGSKYADPRAGRGPPLPPSQNAARAPPLPPPPILPREEAKPPPPPMPPMPPPSAPHQPPQKKSIFDIDSSSSPLATGFGTDLSSLSNIFNSPADLSDVSDLDLREDAAAAAASVDIEPGEILDTPGVVQSLQFPFPAMRGNAATEASAPRPAEARPPPVAMPKPMLVSIPFSKGKIVGGDTPPSESKHREKKKKKKDKKEKKDKHKEKEHKRDKEEKKHKDRHKDKDKDRERKHDKSRSSPSVAVASPSLSVQSAGLKLRIKTVMPSPGDAQSQSVAPIKIKAVRPAPDGGAAKMSRVMGTSFETEHIYLEDNVLKNSGTKRKDVG